MPMQNPNLNPNPNPYVRSTYSGGPSGGQNLSTKFSREGLDIGEQPDFFADLLKMRRFMPPPTQARDTATRSQASAIRQDMMAADPGQHRFGRYLHSGTTGGGGADANAFGGQLIDEEMGPVYRGWWPS